MLHNISNEALVSSLKVKLSDNKRVIILLKAHISDMLFPGTRDLFLKKKSKLRTNFLMTISFLVYLSYYIAFSFTSNVISDISLKHAIIIITPGVVYNVIFALINLKIILKGLRKGV